MLLSEAIKLGSTLGPQLFGVAVRGTGSCALGAAALALGFVPGTPFDLYVHFPDLAGRTTATGEPLLDAIARLNDLCMTPRVKIADWIVASGLDCESVPVPAVKMHDSCVGEVEACC